MLEDTLKTKYTFIYATRYIHRHTIQQDTHLAMQEYTHLAMHQDTHFTMLFLTDICFYYQFQAEASQYFFNNTVVNIL